MGQPTLAQKLNYAKKAYQPYTVRFRKKEDAELIQYIEALKAAGQQTTDIFRDLMNKSIEKSINLQERESEGLDD